MRDSPDLVPADTSSGWGTATIAGAIGSVAIVGVVAFGVVTATRRRR